MTTTPDYYQMDAAALEKHFKTNLQTGLTEMLAKEALLRDGLNTLGSEERKSFVDKIVDELRSPLAFALLIAGIVTTMLAEYVDATVIFLALIVNVLINLYQEGRASQAFDELKAGAAPHCIVVRGGTSKQIPTEQLVCGDIILLQSGTTVPADARVVEAFNAELNESVLTGEWLPVTKHAAQVTLTLPRLEQKNMIFMGTLVASGTLRAVVVETGERTVFGKIGTELRAARPPKTPMQQNIAAITRFLTYIILGALILVVILGLFRGMSFTETLLVSIAIAVAAIPEGLPAVVSVMLAMGMQRILARGGLVRNLLAAETLGSTTVIMTDKTGTLTEGLMHMDRVVCFQSLADDDGYSARKRHEEHGDESDALHFAYLASNVIIEDTTVPFGEPVFHGRPVEVAIARALHASGVSVSELTKDYPCLSMQPFVSEARMSFSLNQLRGLKHNRLFALGAAEEVLKLSNAYYAEGRAHPMGDKERAQFNDAIVKATQQGVRVVALGYTETPHTEIPTGWPAIKEEFFDHGTFVFCALFYLADPIRTDVHRAIAVAKVAGVTVLMATGDNPETARAIAVKAGIIADASAPVLLGVEVEALSDDALREKLKVVRVFARMLPEHKQRIAKLLTADKEIVAMTGDGVNDAPALRSASIGVALGSGTDVAKEASDLVLMNNSFSIIVSAIEEGRRAVDNIRKSIAYLLSTSFSEIILVIAALAMGLPLPLLPAQIIWTNMLTEGFMNFAFAFEKTEEGAMRRDPRVHGAQYMLTNRFMAFIMIIGALSGIILVSLYFALYAKNIAVDDMRTVMFVALTLLTTLISFSLKDLRNPIWKSSPFSNHYLIVAMGITFIGMTIALTVPQIAALLSLHPAAIVANIWLMVVAVVCMFVGTEAVKYWILKKK